MKADFVDCHTCFNLESLRDKLREQGDYDGAAAAQIRYDLHNYEKTLHIDEDKRRCDYAHANPSRAVYISIDGMDNRKLRQPKTKVTTFDTEQAPRLKVQLQGARTSQGTFAFTFLEDIAHDSSFVVETLKRTIQHLSDSNKLPTSMEERVLYLEADNCWRENKNGTVMAYLLALLKSRMFTRIEYLFMIRGHTHNLTDQLFSSLATWLAEREVWTLEEFQDVVLKVFDHHEWIQQVPYVRSWLRKFQTITTPKWISKHNCFQVNLPLV